MSVSSVVGDRIRRTLDGMVSSGIDALMLFSPENIRYLTSFNQACICVILPRDGEPTALGLWLDIDEARGQSWVKDVRGFIPQYPLRIDGNEAQRQRLKEVLIQRGLSEGKIGIEKGVLTLEMFDSLRNGLPKAQFVDASPVLHDLRIVKSEDEVESIKRASEIADCAMEVASQNLELGKRETDLVAEAEYEIRRRGGEIDSRTFVASGKRTLYVHPYPTDRTLKEGDLVMIDIHPSHKGYHSDLCRTFLLGRDAAKEEAYKTLLEAQRVAFEATKVDVDTDEICRVARDTIDASPYGRNFPELYGHGTGLLVEEPPKMARGWRTIIQENMTISFFQGPMIVPGSFGFRVEDTGVVEKKGVEILTRYPIELPR